MTTKYLAEVEFSNGECATAQDNNLRTLKSRIARNFAGEKTDWGFDPAGVTVSDARIFDYSGEREKLVWRKVI